MTIIHRGLVRTDVVRSCGCTSKSDGLAPPREVTLHPDGRIVPRATTRSKGAPITDERAARAGLRKRMSEQWMTDSADADVTEEE